MGLSVTELREVLLSYTSPTSSPTKASPFSIPLHALQKSRKMPFVELVTNVSLTRAQAEELALSLSACAAETLQKPEIAFGINVRANEVLTFAGNQDPCMLPVLYVLLANYHLHEHRTNKKSFTPDD